MKTSITITCESDNLAKKYEYHVAVMIEAMQAKIFRRSILVLGGMSRCGYEHHHFAWYEPNSSQMSGRHSMT